MSQTRSGPPPIFYILLFLLLAGGGYWWFFLRKPAAVTPTAGTSDATAPVPVPDGNPPTATNPFPPPTNVPSGTTVRIDGSTSMVTINQNLKNTFEAQFPGTRVATEAKGSETGIAAIQSGSADLAAISRPLTPQEQNAGLVAVPVTNDAIALVVGVGNPFGQGLTQEQVVGIFQGQITNWSQIGGPDKPIRVLNRPVVSGTHHAFRELVLKGSDFGTTPNITTLERDATTPMLQSLGDDGIGYATASQIRNQTTVRMVAIDGLTPAAANYPYRRGLYYDYKNPPNPAVSAFLGFVGSPSGQTAIANAGN
ncbi:MAG: phosphate ABC transporter substrate-binding protein [Cyanobacteria bacterium J055]|nr:MAG: phosphate ABC transporter substrate-binding protein [Cyanobacteria bacterium J055]